MLCISILVTSNNNKRSLKANIPTFDSRAPPGWLGNGFVSID